MLGELQAQVWNNFTVPLDDANFDPPKFAGWAGKPKVCTLYGMSSLFFFLTGIVVLYLASIAPQPIPSDSYGYSLAYPTIFEGVIYIIVSITSLHGDVLCMGTRSYWHVADRMVAQMLIVTNVRYAVSLVFVDRHVGLTAVVALTLALVSYVSSYHARVFDVYKACHTLWHFTGAMNRAVCGLLGFAYIHGTGYEPRQRHQLYCATLVFLGLEAILCTMIWTWGLSRRGFSWQAKENREEASTADDRTEMSLLKSPTTAERSSSE